MVPDYWVECLYSEVTGCDLNRIILAFIKPEDGSEKMSRKVVTIPTILTPSYNISSTVTKALDHKVYIVDSCTKRSSTTEQRTPIISFP